MTEPPNLPQNRPMPHSGSRAAGDGWLQRAVLDGLQALLALRLRGAPAADTVEAVAQVWLAVFRARPVHWQAERDARRIHEAFLTVAARVEQWPAPVQVLAALPSVPEPRKLPPPPPARPSAEVRAKLRELAAQLRTQPPTLRRKP